MGSREIYNVRYRLDEAKIYDETPFVAGTTMAMNTGKEEASVFVSVAYEDEKSYSFNNSSSSDGVPTTLQAGIPSIVGGSIKIGNEVAIPLKWGETTTTTTSVQATGAVSVPAKSKATISYKGTKGKCDVPFSYTQRDTLPSGTTVAEKTDGLFKGSNAYNIDFSVGNVRPLNG